MLLQQKKIRVTASTICLLKNPTLPFGKKLSKKIASKCDSSKNTVARKLCKKLDCVIP